MRGLIKSGVLSTMPALAAANDLASPDDEFENQTSLSAWWRFDQRWVRDLDAPFLFEELAVGVDVRARVRVRSGRTPVPGGV